MKLTDLPGTKDGHRNRNIIIALCFGYCILVWIGFFAYIAVSDVSDESQPDETRVIIECSCQWHGNLAIDDNNKNIAGFGKEVYPINESTEQVVVGAVKEDKPLETLTITAYQGDEVIARDKNDNAEDPVTISIGSDTTGEP